MKVRLEDKVGNETIRLIEETHNGTGMVQYYVEKFVGNFNKWNFPYDMLKPAERKYIKELMEMKRYK